LDVLDRSGDRFDSTRVLSHISTIRRDSRFFDDSIGGRDIIERFGGNIDSVAIQVVNVAQELVWTRVTSRDMAFDSIVKYQAPSTTDNFVGSSIRIGFGHGIRLR
jgi:hypothetical protein